MIYRTLLSFLTFDVAYSQYQFVINLMMRYCVFLRAVNLRHAEEDGFLLLTTLISCKLVEPSKDVWFLFIPKKSFPSDESLQLLSSLMKNYNLPEKHNPTALCLEDTSDFSSTTHPLRMQLVHWLLAAKDLEEPFPSKDLQYRKVEDRPVSDIRLKAQILIALTLRDSRKVSYCSRHEDTSDIPFKNIADCYLKTTFNTHVIRTKDKEIEQWTINESRVSYVPQIKLEVIKLLKNNGHQLLHAPNLTVSIHSNVIAF